MNQLLNIPEQKSSITMSSREIAELCEKEHRHVTRDIETMFSQLDIPSEGYAHFWTHSQNGQTYREFRLPYDLTLTLISGYSVILRKKIIDRWQELESRQGIPQSFSQALRLAAEQQEIIEQKNHQLALQAPKVAFVEHYVEVGTTKSLRETAKILSFPEKRLIECLERDRVLYRQSGNLLPYQDKQAKQLFAVKTGTAEHGHNFTQTRVTAKGIEWIAQRYASELGQ